MNDVCKTCGGNMDRHDMMCNGTGTEPPKVELTELELDCFHIGLGSQNYKRYMGILKDIVKTIITERITTAVQSERAMILKELPDIIKARGHYDSGYNDCLAEVKKIIQGD